MNAWDVSLVAKKDGSTRLSVVSHVDWCGTYLGPSGAVPSVPPLRPAAVKVVELLVVAVYTRPGASFSGHGEEYEKFAAACGTKIDVQLRGEGVVVNLRH
jgi:hypothetical protein